VTLAILAISSTLDGADARLTMKPKRARLGEVEHREADYQRVKGNEEACSRTVSIMRKHRSAGRTHRTRHSGRRAAASSCA
jgi:hypothetical protein